MPSRPGSWVSVLLLLSWAAHDVDSAAQPAPKQVPPVFGTDVTLVAVPVFVTDKSGKAVPGLSAEDFEVYDGGRRVPIAAFQAVDVDAPVAALPALPIAVQAAAARQFLMLFDLQFSPPGGIVRARTAAVKFVRESLAASDLVAVATFGRNGLKMLTNFTSDHSYVARAIEGLGLVAALEPASDPLGLSGEFRIPPAASMSEQASLADRELAAQLGALQVDLKRAYGQRVMDFLATVEDLAQTLSSLRGRKQIVLLSGGFDKKAWAGPESEAERWDDPQYLSVQARMNDVFRRAGQADVIVHSVDLAGIEGPVDVASWDGRKQGMGAGRGALVALAENTGGRFVLPTNDFARALGEVDQISRHYYVLAFQPAEPAPKRDKPRSLKVRVGRDGMNVSHRSAYVVPVSPPVADAAAVRRAAAEAIAKGLSGGSLGLHLVGLPYWDREGGPTLPVVLHVDGPFLAAAARDERLQIQVYGYAMAADRILDTLTMDTTLDLSKLGDALRSNGLRVLTAFAVSPGSVDLRFFVRVGVSGEVGSIRRLVEVPAFVEGQPVLSSLLLTLPATGTIAVPLKTRSGDRLQIPFRLGSEPFVPDSSPTLQPGRPRDVCAFLWPARTGAADPLEVTGEIAREGEAALPLGIDGARVVPDADGFDRYVVSVVAPGAPAGDYALRLTFRDPGSGQISRSETPIVLGN